MVIHDDDGDNDDDDDDATMMMMIMVIIMMMMILSIFAGDKNFITEWETGCDQIGGGEATTGSYRSC